YPDGAIFGITDPPRPQDIAMALDWFRRGAEKGDTWSMYEIGRIHGPESLGGEPKWLNLAESRKWHKSAAEAGNVHSMIALARILREAREYVEALTWFKRAAENDDDHFDATQSIG